MSSVERQEIQRLATITEFTNVSQRCFSLTERNCIFRTSEQVTRDVQDELYVHEGQRQLTSLTTTRNFSLDINEAQVADRNRIRQDENNNIRHELREIIMSNSNYVDSLIKDLNEKLTQDLSSLLELSKNCDLSDEDLQQDEPSTSFTETFIAKNMADVREILSTITEPIQLNQIMMKCGSHVKENVFFGTVLKLINTGEIDGLICGNGRYFIPSTCSKAQICWTFGLMDNGYAALDDATKIGIYDPKSFISKRFPNEQFLFLETCVLRESFFQQLKEQVEKSLVDPGWIDIGSIIRVNLTEQSIHLFQNSDLLPGVKEAVVLGTVIVSKSLLQNIKASFRTLMANKAEKDISSGRYIHLVNEPPQQGPFCTTFKKWHLRLEFQSQEIRQIISENESLSGCPHGRLDSIAQYISGGLQEEYQTILKETFDKIMSKKTDKREEDIEKLFKMATKFQLYVEGLKRFPKDIELREFLLTSFGQEITVVASKFVLKEAGLDENNEISDLPDSETKQSMIALRKAVTIAYFNDCLQTILLPLEKSFQITCSPNTILWETREKLLNELETAEVAGHPDVFLYISTLILFSFTTDSLLKTSQKFVSQIIVFLRGKLDEMEYRKLEECQHIIAWIKLAKGPEEEEAREHFTSVLLPAIKAMIFKKVK